MIIYDDNGQFQDKFIVYDSDVLAPAIQAIVANAVQWLDDNGASTLDYFLLETVIRNEVELQTQSAWMTRIEQQIGSE